MIYREFTSVLWGALMNLKNLKPGETYGYFGTLKQLARTMLPALKKVRSQVKLIEEELKKHMKIEQSPERSLKRYETKFRKQ